MLFIITNYAVFVNSNIELLVFIQYHQILNVWRSREKVVATVVDNAVDLLE
jgi:hypothetical protein